MSKKRKLEQQDRDSPKSKKPRKGKGISQRREDKQKNERRQEKRRTEERRQG
jgi:hypothetical protein